MAARARITSGRSSRPSSLPAMAETSVPDHRMKSSMRSGETPTARAIIVIGSGMANSETSSTLPRATKASISSSVTVWISSGHTSNGRRRERAVDQRPLPRMVRRVGLEQHGRVALGEQPAGQLAELGIRADDLDHQLHHPTVGPRARGGPAGVHVGSTKHLDDEVVAGDRERPRPSYQATGAASCISANAG